MLAAADVGDIEENEILVTVKNPPFTFETLKLPENVKEGRSLLGAKNSSQVAVVVEVACPIAIVAMIEPDPERSGSTS